MLVTSFRCHGCERAGENSRISLLSVGIQFVHCTSSASSLSIFCITQTLTFVLLLFPLKSLLSCNVLVAGLLLGNPRFPRPGFCADYLATGQVIRDALSSSFHTILLSNITGYHFQIFSFAYSYHTLFVDYAFEFIIHQSSTIKQISCSTRATILDLVRTSVLFICILCTY